MPLFSKMAGKQRNHLSLAEKVLVLNHKEKWPNISTYQKLKSSMKIFGPLIKPIKTIQKHVQLALRR